MATYSKGNKGADGYKPYLNGAPKPDKSEAKTKIDIPVISVKPKTDKKAKSKE